MNRNKLTKLSFALYSGALVAQNILATKQIDIAIFTVTTGILISPIVFIIQDIVSEILGYREAKEMVLTGFLMNFITVSLFVLAINVTPSQFWANQQAFSTILGTTFRITCASFSAYLIGSLMNSKIMCDLKQRYPNYLFFRAITSTIVGQLLDNAVFAFGAFMFILPFEAIVSMIIGGTLIETIYEILFYPITKKIILSIKRVLK